MTIDREDEGVDPAYAPLEEAGEGESEGFELAEAALIENASHGNEHGTSRILFDSPDQDEEAGAAEDGEADEVSSSDLGAA
jgi:hypothetical protein